MGAVDVEALAWEESKEGGSLTGISQVVGGDVYHVRFSVPEGWKVKTENVKVKDAVGVLDLTQPKGGKVKWKVEFAKG